MKHLAVDVCIVGGGTGGWAAALALRDLGISVVVTEPTDWIGGQLTSQGVPSDEHPWIEEFGCTRRYREFRNRVRAYYRKHRQITAPEFSQNPGGGWVSNLCVLPWIAHRVLQDMGGDIAVLTKHKLIEYRGDSVVVQHLDRGEETEISAKWFLDASEDSALLLAAGVPTVSGAESRAMTGEPHAKEAYEPDNIQAMTWIAALGWCDPRGTDHLVEKPARYDFWRSFQPDFWPGPLLGFMDVHPITLQPRHLPLKSSGVELFSYRQIADPRRDADSPYASTIVNWPMNDAFISHDPADARELTACLIYWLQREAPRHDGGTGYPELFLDTSALGTSDGFAMHPYIRECARIRSRHTITEGMIATDLNPGRDRAPAVEKSVGIGAYRVDLHPTTGGDNYLDISSLPFQIPLGSLIPELGASGEPANIIPAAKNIGTTHITNGCYRLHPVEWNIGEAAALLVASCLRDAVPPETFLEDLTMFEDLNRRVHEQGVETQWPDVPLRPL